MDPTFSVVITTHNRIHLLRRAIKSALSQTISDIEILVIDDHSEINPKALIQSLNDDRIYLFRNNRNYGPAYSRNVGIDKANGKYISFLDDDDEWMPRKLEIQLEILEKDPLHRSVCFSPMILKDGPLTSISPTATFHPETKIGDYLFIHNGLIGSIVFAGYTSIFKQFRFNDSLKYHEDIDLYLRLEHAGIKFEYIPTPLAIWYVDNRQDRLSFGHSVEYETRWIEERKKFISKKAYKAFISRNLAATALREKKYWLCIRLTTHGIFSGVITTRNLAGIISKIIFPYRVSNKIKMIADRISNKRRSWHTY